MLRYELLVATRSLATARQLCLEVDGPIEGKQLAELLDESLGMPTGLGQGTGREAGSREAGSREAATPRWYCGQRPLRQLGQLPAGQALLLTDVPRPERGPVGARLKLYVPFGPDAGASLPLTRGVHELGRGSPLWLHDSRVSRVHARVLVDERHIVVRALPGHRLYVPDPTASPPAGAAVLDQPVLDQPVQQVTLREGQGFRVGSTVLRVGDPAAEAGWTGKVEDLMDFRPADAPPTGRLVAQALTALVPLLAGILLMVLTGSLLFLAISSISALLGLIPAGQLVVERRRWRNRVRTGWGRLLHARAQAGACLGASLVAQIERAAWGALPEALPPLVIGRGVVHPPGVAPGLWGRPGHRRRRNLREPNRRERARRAARSGRGGQDGAETPVLAPSTCGVWQLVGSSTGPAGEVLAALLARYLPQVALGRLRLVIDPSLEVLPEQLLLLPGTAVGPAAEDPCRVDEARGVGGWQSAGPVDPAGSSGVPHTLYLTARHTAPRPGQLIIVVNPVVSDQADFVVDLEHPAASRLPGMPVTRCIPDRLDHSRLARLAETCLALVQGVPQPTAAASRIAPEANTLRALLGREEHDAPVWLDFDADGPHVLICGTTGSGKSEALRRIISDLAERYAPRELAFALVDFKGGAGLAVFAALPHTQLFVSDLDAAAAGRTLAQLEHEVVRRERLLSERGCTDLASYRRLPDAPPLPRLLVVVDEFRVFTESVPLAADRIDRLATVGRSLGIHLLLSTQRATGALGAQTRANLNTVLALRVRDAAESLDLVGTPAAARLSEPGQAVIAGATRTAQLIHCALAAPVAPHGTLWERGPGHLRRHRIMDFGCPDPKARARELHEHVRQLADRWAGEPIPPSPFAPPLPTSSADCAAGTAGSPRDWPGREAGSLWCGVRDCLPSGTLEPLVLDPRVTTGLLVCGLPEAGAGTLFGTLSRLPRPVLCLGPNPLPSDASEPATLRVVTGEDSYAVHEALDYLQQLQSPAAVTGRPPLLVLVHGVAGLQAQLDPATFQRLDEVLAGLLRRGPRAPVQVVLAVDRDQALLKSSALCTEQWYFPLGATETLRLAWPRLPQVSALPGRGLAITGRDTTAIQLAPAHCRPAPQAYPGWPEPTPPHPAPESPAPENPELFVGTTALTGTTCHLGRNALSLLICPAAADRADLCRTLAERWGARSLSGIEQLASWVAAGEECQTHNGLGCVLLDSTASGELGPLVQRAAGHGRRLVLFVPPSPRLAYDLGLAGMALDERHVVVAEAYHRQDLQPLSWPALSQRPESEYHRLNGWRAIASLSGQPRAIHIPR